MTNNTFLIQSMKCLSCNLRLIKHDASCYNCGTNPHAQKAVMPSVVVSVNWIYSIKSPTFPCRNTKNPHTRRTFLDKVAFAYVRGLFPLSV